MEELKQKYEKESKEIEKSIKRDLRIITVLCFILIVCVAIVTYINSTKLNKLAQENNELKTQIVMYKHSYEDARIGRC